MSETRTLTDSTYSCEISNEISIENGIIKGIELPRCIKHNSYGEMILELLRADPKFVGQVDGLTDRKETFGVMMEKSVKCSMWMKEQNVKPGDVVGICSHNQMDMYVPCFASLYIGAVYNAWWDTGLTKELAKYFLLLTRPKVLFVTDVTASIALEAIRETNEEVKIVVFGGQSSSLQSLDDILKTQDSAENVASFSCTKLSSLEDPAIILYTSGSTGMPKGVLYSNNTLFNNIPYFSKMGGLKDTVTLLFAPLSWLSGIYGMLRGVVAPVRRIIYPEFTEEKCFQLIEKYKINWIFLGSSPALRLHKSPAITKYDLSSLEKIFVGGAALKGTSQMSLIQAFPRANVYQVYGSTELGCAGVRQSIDFRHGSCGRVIENITMKFIDPETGRILNPNETGEACFKSPQMMKCYYKNPEATRQAIDSQGWLHTGDLMYYDEDGHIFFVDRMKELIKYRGNHVSPTMIEELLQKHPAIHEAAVVSIPHDIDEEHPIAFVAKKPAFQITEEEIRKMVADVLPDYMKLRGGVKFMDELPHTPSDKLDRMALKKLAKSYAE